MKIDEASINHNVVRLIKDLDPWDMSGETDGEDRLRIMTLGYIQGACDLANELKKVLETWNVKLGTPLHIYPDQDIPGEKLYLQLTLLSAQAGLTLIRHSLPQGCKDYSEYYLREGLGARGQGPGSEGP